MKNIDFLAVNTLPANTISYYSGCDDLASNMAAVGACALRLVAAASKSKITANKNFIVRIKIFVVAQII